MADRRPLVISSTAGVAAEEIAAGDSLCLPTETKVGGSADATITKTTPLGVSGTGHGLESLVQDTADVSVLVVQHAIESAFDNALYRATVTCNGTVGVFSLYAETGGTQLSWNGPVTLTNTPTVGGVAVSLSTHDHAGTYQPLDATLTALAAANWAANAFPIGTGADALAQTTFAANTFPARASSGNLAAKTISDDALAFLAAANDGAMRTELGLGTAATQNTGTSGANVPLLNGTNTWSGTQTVPALVVSINSGIYTPRGSDSAVVPMLLMATGTNTTSLRSGYGTGAGAVVGLSFEALNGTVLGYFQASGRLVLNDGLVSVAATAGIGYGTGAGGTVTQATSKSTGVTLNKACGEITMNGAALAAATIVSFTLTNSAIAATDVLVLNHVTTGTRGAYGLNAQCAAGSAVIYVRNNSAGSLSEAIVLRFALIKGVTS